MVLQDLLIRNLIARSGDEDDDGSDIDEFLDDEEEIESIPEEEELNGDDLETFEEDY
jgi:hypothetical protein